MIHPSNAEGADTDYTDLLVAELSMMSIQDHNSSNAPELAGDEIIPYDTVDLEFNGDTIRAPAALSWAQREDIGSRSDEEEDDETMSDPEDRIAELPYDDFEDPEGNELPEWDRLGEDFDREAAELSTCIDITPYVLMI